MADMMQLLSELSGSLREMMALVLVMKRTRANTLLHSWIDGQQVMDTLKINGVSFNRCGRPVFFPKELRMTTFLKMNATRGCHPP